MMGNLAKQQNGDQLAVVAMADQHPPIIIGQAVQ
jgi:hypothetical protein